MKIDFAAPSKAVHIELTHEEATKVVEDAKGALKIRIGIGKPDSMNRRKTVTIARKAVKLAREHKISAIAVSFADFRFKNGETDEYELGRLLGEAFEMANYEFTKYKTPPKGGFPTVATVYVRGASKSAQQGFRDGQIIAREVNYCRDLANTPGGDMTPALLAAAAVRQVKGTKAKVTVLGPAEIKKLKMGLVLSVDQGSAQPPRFIVVEYWGGKKSESPIVLVGKGITFDTGGVNLKPSNSLVGMNQDMAGGAAVIATVTAVARMGLKKNVIALVPAVENAISGSATRPGDIFTAMNGITVEVLNTDAEGRLILGDALTYAERYKPRLVVDVATLTGAAITVLGKHASVIMAKGNGLEDMLRDLGEKSGEYVWPLPMWDEYLPYTKGIHADIANVPPGEKSAGAGSILGGMFLSHFTKKFDNWAHIDIAPRMESIPDDNLAKGATGTPIRLLVRLIEQFK